MNIITYNAFVDEMEKIAAGAVNLRAVGDVAKRGGKRVLDAVREGWHAGADVPGRGWLGTGYQASPTDSRLHKVIEGVTSLGGTTKYLPVGPKALTVGFTGLALPGAIKKEDPTGEGKSRLERVGSLAGGTVAGLASAKMGLIPALAIGAGGDIAGGTIGRVLSPRRRVLQAPPPEAAQQVAPRCGRNQRRYRLLRQECPLTLKHSREYL
jgi:hypothetical protein